jgi:hypothetical protein
MKRILFVALPLLGAGCGPTLTVQEGNYMTFDHAFTDRAAEEVRQRAERLCAQKKQVAIKTSRACSLERCTTNYQCVDRGSAKP